MKHSSKPIGGRQRSSTRGAGLLEALILLAAALMAWSLWWGSLGGWTEGQLVDLAARAETIASQADRAGVRLVVPGNLDATLERIAAGGTAKSGPFAGQHYSLPELGKAPPRQLKRHLKVEQGRLLVREAEERKGA